MKNFVFQNPTRVIFGKDEISKLGEEVAKASKKVLLVYGGGSVKRNGVYRKVADSLRGAGVEFVELGGIKPNPVLSKVHEGIEAARREKVDGIVALGGGSVIDTSKTVAAGFYYDGDIWDAFVGKYKAERSLPIFTVLTISATGSEMNGIAVITNEGTKQKFSFWSFESYPKVSVMDPTVQFSLPWIQTANGAADAIAHVVELYFDGTDKTRIVDELSEGIIRTVIDSTDLLMKDPEDYDARANLVWSATMALNGFNGVGRNGGDWSSHAIEHSLSALFDVAHGSGLSVVVPAWMSYVYEENVAKFARFGKEIFGITAVDDSKAALEGIKNLKDWYRKIGLPVSLEDVGISADDIGAIVENASMRTPFGRIKKLQTSDVRAILELCV